MKEFNVDYWGYFKYCVKQLGITPSEAWRLDLVEIDCLSEIKQESNDLSIMLNFERKINGATKEWLDRGDLSQLNH